MQEVYERDMEQRLQEMIDERMDRVVEQLTDRMATILGNQNRRRPLMAAEIDKEEEVPHRHPRVAAANDDRRRWEAGIRTEIPEFHGSLRLEEFLDWLATVEKILDFKDVP